MRKATSLQSHSHKRLALIGKVDTSIKNQPSTTIINSANTTIHFKDISNRSSTKNTSTCRYYQCCNEPNNKDPVFKPQIHQIPYQLYPDNWQHIAKSKRDHWEELIQDNRSRYQQRTQKKLREEENKLKEFTFSPQIRTFQLDDSPINKENVYEKLYQEADKRKALKLSKEQQIADRQREQMEKYKCASYNTDKWKILNKQKYDLNPLYKRLEKVIQQKKRNKKMIAERQKVQYSFKPEINTASKEIIHHKNQIINVVDRLIDEYKKKEGRINSLRDKYEIDYQKELTFKPAINNYLPATSDRIKEPRETSPQYSYAPTIDPLSALMMQDRNYETNQQKLFRLHNAPLIKKADNLNHIEAELYSECCFNPEINTISRMMNSAQPKQHMCHIKQCPSPTHKPRINEVSQFMTQSKRAKSLDNTKKKIKEKAQDYKRKVQYAQMKQCSFKPKIKENKSERKQVNHQMSLDNVAGFKRFYENKEKAQLKQQRRKELEDKLFHLQKSYDLRMKKGKKNGQMPNEAEQE